MHKAERDATIKLADQVIDGQANQERLRQQIRELGEGASSYNNIEDREPDITSFPQLMDHGLRGIL